MASVASVLPASPDAWNSLPSRLHCIDYTAVFKRKLNFQTLQTIIWSLTIHILSAFLADSVQWEQCLINFVRNITHV